MGYNVSETVATGDPSPALWSRGAARAINDTGRRIASKDALGIARVSWANCSAVPSKNLVLGSSTFANTGADSGRGEVEIFALAVQVAYPIDGGLGMHPMPWVQTLAQAAASPPTGVGIHWVNASTGGVNSSTVLDTTKVNQIIAYAPQTILHSYWANNASTGGINAATTKSQIMAWIAQIDAGYTSTAAGKPVHILVNPHARGDANWINGAAAMGESIDSYRKAVASIVDDAPNKNVAFVDQGLAFAGVGFVGDLNVNPRSMMDPASPTYVHLNNKGHRFGADNLRLEIIGR